MASTPSEAPVSDREVSSSRARLLDVVPIAWLDQLLVASLDLPLRAASRRSWRRSSTPWPRSSRRMPSERASFPISTRPRASPIRATPGSSSGSPRGSSSARGIGPDSPLSRPRLRARRRGPRRRRGLDAAPRVGRPRARSRRLPRRAPGRTRRDGSRPRLAERARGGRRARGRAAIDQGARAANDPGRQAGDLRTGRGGRRPRAQQSADVDRGLLRLPDPRRRRSRGSRRRGRRAPAADQRGGQPHAPLHARARQLRPTVGWRPGTGDPSLGHRSRDRVLRARAVGRRDACRARLRARRAHGPRGERAARAGVREPDHQRLPGGPAFRRAPRRGDVLRHQGSGGRSVLIVIEDNGTGIAVEHVAHVFAPFFTTKSEKNGTGLGLSIVKSIVEGHGGEVRVDSELGRGTRFVLELPQRS